MGGERSSTVRQILAGKICALCRRTLDPPRFSASGERLCEACRAVRGRHRVYVSFTHCDGWFCQFLEEDLKTPLPRKLHFRSPDKIRELARRGGCTLNLEGLQALDRGIEIGRGGLWLELSEEQYAKLKVP